MSLVWGLPPQAMPVRMDGDQILTSCLRSQEPTSPHCLHPLGLAAFIGEDWCFSSWL